MFDDMSPPIRPTRQQMIFNWLMAESDFATKTDGYWGDQEDVDRIDELLAALDAYASDAGTE